MGEDRVERIDALLDEVERFRMALVFVRNTLQSDGDADELAAYVQRVLDV